MAEQTASAQALVDAKNEVLALQEVLHQRDAELSLLRDTMRQRDEDARQLAARLDAATRDYAVAHEDSRQLREKVRQCEETLAVERAEHSSMLSELHGESAIIERESARLAVERLHRENEELRRREAESAQVVGRLMADVEAGRRSVVHPPQTVTYSKEEHEADVERQLLALRAELEEMFGEDIRRMKEQMRDHHSATVDQLQRDLARSEEERSRCASQVSLWQQQYMVLSRQGVSSVDITQRLNDAIADNVQQRQHVVELTAQVEQLNTQLSLSLPSPLSSQSVAVETSSEAEAYKREVAENIFEQTSVLHAKIDELRSLLKNACEDRDQSIARSHTVEQELEAVRQELLSTYSEHSGQLQQLETKAASNIAQLTTQLALAKEQLNTMELAGTEAKSTHSELQHALHETQSQFEAVKKDYEHRIEQLKVDNADAVKNLSSKYAQQLESEQMKMTAALDEYKSREQKSTMLIEELQMKFELVNRENSAITEQLQHQSGPKPLKTEIVSTPSAAVMGASDVDSVVADLSVQLEKVTRERDSAMQSLQTVYGDRIELQQTIKKLESERNSLTAQVNHLDAERQSVGEQLAQTRSQLLKLKNSAISHSTAGLYSVGTGSIPNMPSVTAAADTSRLVDSLRAEFEELQRLRLERDHSSSLSNAVTSSSVVRVPSHSEATVNLTSAAKTDSAAGQNLSTEEAEEMLTAEEVATMKQEYSALCAELVRLREMLITLKRVDREREQVRSQFEYEICLLRDELLRLDHIHTAAATGNVTAALDDELKERDAEINSLKGSLAMTLSRMEEVIAEKDQQCASYEHELEEVREEHSSALRRIDALVQEHNIILGGQVPFSSIAPENVREMPVVVHSEILESVDEDVSPKRIVYENQAKEIEHLCEQLHCAAQEIEALTLDRDRLNETLEANATELLARLEKVAHENTEQQQMYERKITAYSQDMEQLSRKVDIVSAELERSNAAHLSEMAKVRDEYQSQFNELSFSNEEWTREQHQEMSAVRKQCTELQTQLEKLTAEKVSMEQEYVTVIHDISKENSARISALHENFEQDLAQARLESEKAYSDHTVQIEEELNQSRQELAQLKQSLGLYESGAHHSDKRKSEDEDLDILQVLQLRINDLTETKDELQQRLDIATSKNEQLSSEVEALVSEKEALRSQVATLPPDYPHGSGSLDAESAADTSGDSHIFYTPSTSRKSVVEKLKSVQAEKELLTNMVERLNAEKEQLKAYLVTKQQPTQVFEADIIHLELSSPEMVDVDHCENSAEVRVKELESEKELLAGMLEKLGCEKEQLIALTTVAAGADNVLDMSYDDGLDAQFDTSAEKSVTLEACEESELMADEVVALRHDNELLRAKLSDLEGQLSSVNVLMPEGLRVGSVKPQQTMECTAAGDFALRKAVDDSEHDQSREDPSLNAEKLESPNELMDMVRTLEERLSVVAMERDRLTADLDHVVQECVELKAGQADLSETTKHSVEVLRNELDSSRLECESLAQKQAATDTQLAEVKDERDELYGKIGGLQDALKSAVEEKERCMQSWSGAVAQLPATPGSVTVEADMEHGETELQKLHEATVDENELMKSNIWLQSRVSELEVVRVNLLEEKESVAGQYSMTVNELKERLVRMQEMVESLQSEDNVKSEDLAELRSKCEERQKIIDEITNRLQSIGGNSSDGEDSTEISLVSKVDFLQSEIFRLQQENSDPTVPECKKVEDLLHGEDRTFAKESKFSGLAVGEAGTDFIDAGASERQWVDVSCALSPAKPLTGEQYTMTEESAFSGTYNMHVSDVHIKFDPEHSDEDVSALHQRLQMLKAKLEAVTEERDQHAAILSELEHSSPKPDDVELMPPKKPEIIDDADFAVMGIDSRPALEIANTDFAHQSSEETISILEDGQMKSDKATEHKEFYIRLHSRQSIAVSDVSTDVMNITEESTTEAFDAAVEANISDAENADCSLLVKIDELLMETCALKEERDEIKQKLLLAELSVRETVGSANDKIKALENELVCAREELHRFEARYDEQQETAQTLVVTNQKLTEEWHAIGVERDCLSAQLESAELDLQQLSAGTGSDVASMLETLHTELKNATMEKSELLEKLADVGKTCKELQSQLDSSLEDRNTLMIQFQEVETERTELQKSAVDQQKALVDIDCLQKECCRLKEENSCLNERCDAYELARSAVESQLSDQQQMTLSLQSEHHELTQTKGLLLSENGSLKQQISEYIEKINAFTSNEQLALEKWTRTEEELLAKIKRLEVDLSTITEENSTLKSEVDRVPMLTRKIDSIAAEREDAHKCFTELAAEVVTLRKNMEDVNSKFDVTSLELTETKAELTRCRDQAECEIDRLNKLTIEKTNCVRDLQLALATTQEELAASKKERENLSNAFNSERDAFKEQTAANEAAMTEFKSRLAIAEMASSKLELLEKELALKCEGLKEAEDRLMQQQSVQEHLESADSEVRMETLQSECENLRSMVSSCQMVANTAQEKLSQMEGRCRALMAERDELAEERSALHAANDEMSRKLMLLQEQLEQIGTDADDREIKPVEPMHEEQLDAASQDVVKLAVNDDTVGPDDQNLNANRCENQIADRNVKSDETVQLHQEIDSLQHDYQQLKRTAEDSLNAVMQESESDTVRQLQQELAEDWSTQSTEGHDEWQTSLDELDSSTPEKTTAGESSVHASRTFTKLESSDIEDAAMSTFLTDDRYVSLATEVKTLPGSPPERNTSPASVYPSSTFTKLVSTDTIGCQTIAEVITDESEINVNDLYSQINSLRLALEQQKLSHDHLMEKLQTDCMELAEARDVLMQENGSLTEQLKEKHVGVDAGTVTDFETIQSHIRAEIEAETRQHHHSEMEALETEYLEILRALQEDCDRQLSAAENCVRTKILETSPSETFVAESVLSAESDSTDDVRDVIGQRDQLKSDLADKLNELAELKREIEQLREENQKQKASLPPTVALSENVEPGSVDLDEQHQRFVTPESRLLMSTEENEKLLRKINELEQQAHQQLVEELNTVRQQMEEQHLTEMKVLEFRLQASHETSLSHVRKEVEAELEQTYRKRKENLDAEFKKKAENFRRETEDKFLQEIMKVRMLIIL